MLTHTIAEKIRELVYPTSATFVTKTALSMQKIDVQLTNHAIMPIMLLVNAKKIVAYEYNENTGDLFLIFTHHRDNENEYNVRGYIKFNGYITNPSTLFFISLYTMVLSEISGNKTYRDTAKNKTVIYNKH